MIAKRIEQVQKKLEELNAEALFVIDQANVRYLSGFAGISPHETEGTVLITKNTAYLFVPNMYAQQARKHSSVTSNIITLLCGKSLLSGFIEKIVAEDSVLIEEETMTLKTFVTLKKKHENLVANPSPVTPLRLIKSKQEVASIQKAIAITAKALENTVEHVKKNWQTLTEQDVALFLIARAYYHGAEGIGFDPIIATGSGSSQPHYRPTNKPLQKGPLLIDNGFTVNGYTSDITRTYFIGEPTEQQRKMYQLVLRANTECVAACKPTMQTSDLHQLSVDMFEKEKVADNYLHSLGHGYGLDVHEAPSVSAHHSTTLKPGMTITIEPGLYFENNFGIRIEDDILVTEEGCTDLSKAIPKQLIVL